MNIRRIKCDTARIRDAWNQDYQWVRISFCVECGSDGCLCRYSTSDQKMQALDEMIKNIDKLPPEAKILVTESRKTWGSTFVEHPRGDVLNILIQNWLLAKRQSEQT